MEIVIGVDVGSSGCKVLAVDSTGQVVMSSSKVYSTEYPRPGWAEQDPEDWFRSACECIRQCVQSDKGERFDVAAMAVVGPAHNVAILDETDRVVRPTIHWSDLRSQQQAARLASEHGAAVLQISGQPVNVSWTLSQLYWLKENESESWRKLRRVLATKDYVQYRLTGTYATDIYDAIGTQLFDLTHGCWSATLCDLIGLSIDVLPPVLPCASIAGRLTREAAELCGVAPGIPVAVGTGDSSAEAFGSGAFSAGEGVVKLGTAACVNVVTEHPIPSEKTLTYTYLDGSRGLTIAATNAGTASLRWFRERFLAGENMTFEELVATAATAGIGADGLLFHPYLQGERTPYWDPHLRGDFIGIRAHHELRHFARAILEGVAYSLRDCLSSIRALPAEVGSAKLLGGGTKSRLWSQIVADVLGLPLECPPVPDAAYGAALLAGVAVGSFASLEDAIRTCVRIEETIGPNSEAHDRYSSYYELYGEIAADLKQRYHELDRIAEGENGGKK